MQQSKAKPIFTRKEYLANTSRQEFVFLNSFQALVSNSLFLPTLRSHSVLGEAWKSYTGRLGESRGSVTYASSGAGSPVCHSTAYVCVMYLSSVCQAVRQAPLIFCITVGETICEQDVYRENKRGGRWLRQNLKE